MGIQRAVLLIADIGGYTNYMHWNRKHLAHAQWTVAQLLESVIDAAKGMKLAKLEGDAAFFWAPGGNTSVLVCDRPPQMRQRFRTRREQIKKDHPCDCKSCEQRDNLSIKFVAHEGEVAEQKVKRNVELAGVDVILVHRMLKNEVPVSEYLFMTDVVAQCLDESVRKLATPLTHDFEGIGETSTHYIDLTTSDMPPAVPDHSFFGLLWAGCEVRMARVTVPVRFQEGLCRFPQPGPRRHRRARRNGLIGFAWLDRR